MMRPQTQVLGWVLRMCALLIGAWDGTASSEPLTVNWNLGTKGIQYADIYAAIEKGLFKEQQIEVALTASSTSPGTLLIVRGRCPRGRPRHHLFPRQHV